MMRVGASSTAPRLRSARGDTFGPGHRKTPRAPFLEHARRVEGLGGVDAGPRCGLVRDERRPDRDADRALVRGCRRRAPPVRLLMRHGDVAPMDDSPPADLAFDLDA